ncbi:hypothetical protein SK803_43345 [Lentzea sp. BCCO 10_0856]|uniref:Cytochrome C biogenesis protein transmembrane region n=1 Tax=Lentzea miocenica TaxID=3095431 RepID=A0ABU4TFV0_9PSEU|nr:hypothetical protein [Lentzea sp. BCCO 10_0856]MDX8037069.1 hypothetical protein [Lentzea sp. BCCO 10_0856]
MTVLENKTAGPLGTGPFPEHRRRVVALSVLCGFLLTVVWSASFVDRVIGDNVANTLLGHDAKATPITGVLAGIVFAFVSGLAGSLTACNVAVFGAVGPLIRERPATVRETFAPLGWIAAGMISVSAVYGAVVAVVGTRMPQFSTAASTGGLSPRNIQSMIAFGVVGLGFLWLGLIALGLLRNPMARHPRVPLVLMGALIGGLLVGRPFALFRVLFRDSAESHDIAYSVAAFVLQSVGNIVVMALLFLVLVHGTRGRLQRWFAAKPARLSLVTGAGLLIAGTFTLLYWDVRVLARAGVLWYPMIGW